MKRGAPLKRAPPKRSSPPRKRRAGPPRRSSRVLDPAYLAWLRTMRCWSCWQREYAHECAWPRDYLVSEAAHIGLSTETRGMSQKVSDTSAIPLCAGCHQHSNDAIHKGNPDAFFAARGSDRDSVIDLFNGLWRAAKKENG